MNYERGIRLFADVMDVEETGVLNRFVEAGAELMRTQVAPEADAFTFAQIASHTGVTVGTEDLSDAVATDVLAALRAFASAMDGNQVTTGSRHLFITPHAQGRAGRLLLREPHDEQPRAKADVSDHTIDESSPPHAARSLGHRPGG